MHQPADFVLSESSRGPILPFLHPNVRGGIRLDKIALRGEREVALQRSDCGVSAGAVAGDGADPCDDIVLRNLAWGDQRLGHEAHDLVPVARTCPWREAFD